LKKHGEDSFFDKLSLQTNNFSLENFIVIDAFVEQNKDNVTSDLQASRDKLVSYMEVKYKIASLEAKIQKDLVKRILPKESAA